MAATVIALTVEPHGSVLTEPCMACTRLCSLETNDLGFVASLLFVLVPTVFLIILFIQTNSREG